MWYFAEKNKGSYRMIWADGTPGSTFHLPCKERLAACFGNNSCRIIGDLTDCAASLWVLWVKGLQTPRELGLNTKVSEPQIVGIRNNYFHEGETMVYANVNYLSQPEEKETTMVMECPTSRSHCKGWGRQILTLPQETLERHHGKNPPACAWRLFRSFLLALSSTCQGI